MALATESPVGGVLKLLASPRTNRDTLMPALGAVSVVALAVAHFQLWAAAYADMLPGLYLQLLLFAGYGLGFIVGGLLVLWLSEGLPQLGLVPVSAIGLVWFDWNLQLPAAPDQVISLWALWQQPFGQMPAWLGFWSALFALPQLGLLIQRSTATTQRRNTLLMGLGLVLAVLLGYWGAVLIQSWELFAASNPYRLLALSGLLVSALVLQQLPIAFIQFFAWLIMRLFYRIQTRDLHHIPSRGPVLLVCNHVSFIDSFVVGGSIKREPRFVMDVGFYQVPILNWLFRTVKAIPIAPAKKNPELLEQAYDRIEQELLDGQVVLVFPEGAITWDGEMIDFKEGVERIVKRTPVRVVPVALRGLWGSWFSRSSGGTFKGFPRLWKKLEVRAGEVVKPEEVNAADLQRRVQALRGSWR